MKQARNSDGAPYDCKFEWGENCFVQCGTSGLVLKKGGLEKTLNSESVVDAVANLQEHYKYTTAFFEAFPHNPDTFIRGEGKTIEEAEESAWNKFTKFSACEHPEFEKRGYRNGAGFCVKCGMFKSKAFDAWESCKVCGKLTFWHAEGDKMTCKKCFYSLPYDSIGSMKHFYTEEDWLKYQKRYNKKMIGTRTFIK